MSPNLLYFVHSETHSFSHLDSSEVGVYLTIKVVHIKISSVFFFLSGIENNEASFTWVLRCDKHTSAMEA